ncbi:sensor histidine kinase [Cryptosporangium aurantiacum]|uniref:histidine kinase n=1 Tax=Cryptosporangium aurantiacum TaxID=134849 RepID=A0A1M7RB56_9ACTN|nr:sensor histidine kinase [Cryptosporangium aurantiacum]SHN43527.1 Signal transduction histidine kinase [Cryptosporangium aurantiacum]
MIQERLRATAGAVRTLTGRALRRSGPLPPLSRHNWLFDLGLAFGLGLIAILTLGEDGPDQPARRVGPDGFEPLPPEPVRPPIEPDETAPWSDWSGQALMCVLIVAPLVFRRRYPLSMLWVVLVTAQFVVDEPELLRLSFYVCVIAAYSAAVYSPYRLPALASLPAAALFYAELQRDAAEPHVAGAFAPVDAVPSNAVPFLILVPIGVAAYGLRSWRSRADAERARAAALEQERAEAVRRATARERARIARELHDVVTHNVSVMVIQAGAARKVLDSAPDQARDALLAVEAGGRAAMTELRHVMGLLTIDTDDAEPDLAPQPGLAQVEPLIDRVRAAGVAVELVVTGAPGPLPEGIDLAAYRVVQEALTNTVKHAAGAPAVVRIDYGADRLWIEVTDAGGLASESHSDGLGQGLIGLRERLAVYGGTLQAGPRIRGGYRVEAVIPLRNADVPRLPVETR